MTIFQTVLSIANDLPVLFAVMALVFGAIVVGLASIANDMRPTPAQRRKNNRNKRRAQRRANH